MPYYPYDIFQMFSCSIAIINTWHSPEAWLSCGRAPVNKPKGHEFKFCMNLLATLLNRGVQYGCFNPMSLTKYKTAFSLFEFIHSSLSAFSAYSPTFNWTSICQASRQHLRRFCLQCFLFNFLTLMTVYKNLEVDVQL